MMKKQELKSPQSLLSDYFIAPILKMKKSSGKIFHQSCEKISNFIFDKSKETALIMLFFNAIAIYSSHTAQIHGLEKSNRENKDFLIDQELKERKIDLFLTVIPPYLLKNYLSKHLEDGSFTTKSAKKKLTRGVSTSVGAVKDDLYNSSAVPVKETLLGMLSDFTEWLVDNRGKIPNCFNAFIPKLKEFNNYLQSKVPDGIPSAKLDTMVNRFDDRLKESKIKVSNALVKNLRNGSAYDELAAQNSGLLVLATLLYTVVATNIIMPYLKNKLSNKEYEKNLKLNGETRESMRRKRRFAYTNFTDDQNQNGLFHENFENKLQTPSFSSYNLKRKQENPFEKFAAGNNLYTNNWGMKI